MVVEICDTLELVKISSDKKLEEEPKAELKEDLEEDQVEDLELEEH